MMNEENVNENTSRIVHKAMTRAIKFKSENGAGRSEWGKEVEEQGFYLFMMKEQLSTCWRM